MYKYSLRTRYVAISLDTSYLASPKAVFKSSSQHPCCRWQIVGVVAKIFARAYACVIIFHFSTPVGQILGSPLACA